LTKRRTLGDHAWLQLLLGAMCGDDIRPLPGVLQEGASQAAA
jgi:hypothetical protein